MGAGGRGVERAGGERNGAATGRAASVGVPDPELVEVPRRRRFTAEYKLRIVREAEACTSRGEIGELLRREGLYSSLLTEWRRARDGGALAGLERPRGPKANPLEAENARLRRRAGARGGGAREGAAGDRGAGKRLRALGRVARAQGRARRASSDDRADRCRSSTPLIGTRPACRALGAAPATIYRRRRPPEPRPHRPRPVPARALSEREREAVLGRTALGAVRRRLARRRSGRRCWTRAATWPRSARCTGCSPPSRRRCGSVATS